MQLVASYFSPKRIHVCCTKADTMCLAVCYLHDFCQKILFHLLLNFFLAILLCLCAADIWSFSLAVACEFHPGPSQWTGAVSALIRMLLWQLRQCERIVWSNHNALVLHLWFKMSFYNCTEKKYICDIVQHKLLLFDYHKNNWLYKIIFGF